MHLLDTSVLIDIERESPQTLEMLRSLDELPVLSFMTFCEFLTGALCNGKKMETITAYLSPYTILHTDTQVCIIFSQLKALLGKKGRPIGDADVFIAALSIRHDATLITKDKHFRQIPGLDVMYIA